MSLYEDLYDRYVKTSARYCADLFKTAASFFDANSALESLIVAASLPQRSQIKVIQELFANCTAAAKRTISQLEQFRDTHLSMPGEQLAINFEEQNYRLVQNMTLSKKIEGALQPSFG